MTNLMIIYDRIPKFWKSIIGLRTSKLIPESAVLIILTGRLKGCRWKIKSGVLEYVLGNYESKKAKLFASEISKSEVVFDIGSNVGYYSLLSSILVGAGGKIIAFEPVPRNISYFRKNMELNKRTNVTLIEAAIGNHDGYTTFKEGNGPSTGTVEKGGNLIVAIHKLDTLMKGGVIPLPHCIKIDIEGGELEALSGVCRINKVE